MPGVSSFISEKSTSSTSDFAISLNISQNLPLLGKLARAFLTFHVQILVNLCLSRVFAVFDHFSSRRIFLLPLLRLRCFCLRNSLPLVSAGSSCIGWQHSPRNDGDHLPSSPCFVQSQWIHSLQPLHLTDHVLRVIPFRHFVHFQVFDGPGFFSTSCNSPSRIAANACLCPVIALFLLRWSATPPAGLIGVLDSAV